MDNLFGLETWLLAAITATLLAAVLGALTLIAWRRPLLVRLGLRAVPRRLLRSLLIVAGLATSTAVITTAIGTGETMTATIRAVVAGGIGPVDQIIVATGTAVREPGLRDPRAVLSGSELAAGAFFPEADAAALAARMASDPDIAALTPAVQVQATAVAAGSGRARTGVNVLGVRPERGVFDTFTAAGAPISLADLGPGEVLINLEAARLLEAAPGDEVNLLFTSERDDPLRRTIQGERASTAEQSARWQVRGVIEDGGLAGLQPAAFVALPALQAALDRGGQINQILVSNRGGEQSVRYSPAVTGRLRLALADPEIARRIARALATEAGQSQLRALESRVRPNVRPRIEELRREARAGEPTARLAYLLGEPALTSQYRWILNAAASDATLRGSGDIVQRVAPLTVLEVKQRAITAANEYGSAVTTIFLILGLFSIAASLLLVFLIFVMLAAERRTEMGLMRAVGVQRRHLIAAFAVEGLVYDLVASAAGLALGIGIGAAVINLLQGVVGRFDVAVRGTLSPAGMLLAFALGALVTFATVLVAAWRVSRVNIIAAIHGVPDSAMPSGARRAGRWAALRASGLRSTPVVLAAVAGTALLIAGRPTGREPLLAAGLSLLLLAAAFTGKAAAVAHGLQPRIADRVIATVCGPAIALFFAAFSPAAPRWVRSDEIIRWATLSFVVAGVAMALALVWAAGRNLDLLLAPVRLLARPFGALAPATRMAVAYPLTHPFRTGLTAVMFALVFLTMVTATALLRSTQAGYVRQESGAGFDLRATFTTPPANFDEALARSTAVRRDDFTVVASQASATVEAIWPDDRVAAWRPLDLRLADDALLAASEGTLAARATGYASDAAVWRAMREQPGFALASRSEAESLPGVRAALAGSGARFEPAAVWVRDPRGGPARKLTVIGVVADGSVLSGGVLTGRAALTGTPAATLPAVDYFFRTREDVSYRTAATGIALTFPDNGVRARVLGDEQQTAEAIRSLLDSLVRGFLGMGLASGIAALGVIGMRSVAERRQQIGMLRAIGFSRRMVEVTFLIEGSVVAVLGITIGGGVGLILARNVVAFLARDFQQMVLVVPWAQVGAVAAAAYLSALISALIVAWRAGRVSPAEALRYE